MAEHETEGGQGESEVKVNDRRLFTPDGQLRGDAVVEETANFGEETPELSVPEAEATPEFERQSIEEPSGVDFTMLINAMAEPALLFLGEIPHPSTGQPTVDLERARIQIDMLDLLRVKCRGNLAQDESGLLDRILYQLRMLCVARANQPEQKQ